MSKIENNLKNLILFEELKYAIVYIWFSLKKSITDSLVDNYQQQFETKYIKLFHEDKSLTTLHVSNMKNNLSDLDAKNYKQDYHKYLKRAVLIESMIRIEEYVIEKGYRNKNKNGKIYPNYSKLDITDTDMKVLRELRKLRNDVIHSYKKKVHKISYAKLRIKILSTAKTLSKI
jgi:uncharacterized protein YutE (UPF0331/DUF86 family)